MNNQHAPALFRLAAENALRGNDEEAIRLLQEGPKWIPGSIDGTPTEMEVELKVKFK